MQISVSVLTQIEQGAPLSSVMRCGMASGHREEKLGTLSQIPRCCPHHWLMIRAGTGHQGALSLPAGGSRDAGLDFAK